MLSVDSLVVCYQELRALQGVSLKIKENDLLGLIGSNGAGKTTLLNTISGLKAPKNGEIRFNGESIVGKRPDQICSLGITQVPEGRKLFPKMSVYENLEVGAYLPLARSQFKTSLIKVFELFPRLAERRKQYAGSLSGGEQQMLALGRALMATPKLLMLDEPSLGLAPITSAEIFRIISDLHRAGLTMLLVSQEVHQALSNTSQGYVLENGLVVLSGSSEGLLADSRIRQAYLGI
jgi:branched-chain amino acid transport system ATP-binding protein